MAEYTRSCLSGPIATQYGRAVQFILPVTAQRGSEVLRLPGDDTFSRRLLKYAQQLFVSNPANTSAAAVYETPITFNRNEGTGSDYLDNKLLRLQPGDKIASMTFHAVEDSGARLTKEAIVIPTGYVRIHGVEVSNLIEPVAINNITIHKNGSITF